MIVRVARPIDARLPNSDYRITNADGTVNVVLPKSPLLRKLFRNYEFVVFYEVTITPESEFVFEKKLKGAQW